MRSFQVADYSFFRETKRSEKGDGEMKQIWKWIMHLDAKAFCLTAALLFCATTGWCMYLYMTPPESFKPMGGQPPSSAVPPAIGILDFVDYQLAGNDIVTPISPFRFPGVEHWVNGMPPVGENKPPVSGTPTFQGSQNNGNNTAGNKPPVPPKDTGIAMITPKITFLGFFKGPDGNRAAMFADSSDGSKIFYGDGKTVHGLEILGADMEKANVRHPDGTVTTIPIGGFIELTPEPRTGNG
jgi:hypothetical protein